jgi:DNA-3-methyladenine glycosylase II
LSTILDSDAALKSGLEALAAADPTMGRLITEGARPGLRQRQPGFEGLAWIVVGQQLSVASAKAIWTRVKGRFPTLSPGEIRAVSNEDLRAVGLSAPKIKTLRAIAGAVLDGALPLDELAQRPADEAHRLLVGVKGIGPWTADIYLLFCLGHSDSFPAGDLALQEAARIAYGFDARPSATDLVMLAEGWRPWRGVAAKVLWAYYRLQKARDGVVSG